MIKFTSIFSFGVGNPLSAIQDRPELVLEVGRGEFIFMQRDSGQTHLSLTGRGKKRMKFMAHERFYVQCNMFLQLGIRASFAAWFSVGERSKIYIQLRGGNLAKGIPLADSLPCPLIFEAGKVRLFPS